MPQQDDDELRELFPFARSWRSLYIFVLAELVVLILLFLFIGSHFS